MTIPGTSGRLGILVTALGLMMPAAQVEAQGPAVDVAEPFLPVEDAYPHVSRDSMVVFHSNRVGGSKLFVARLDGTGLRQLTTGVSQDVTPVWSPDGQHVMFAGTVNGNEDIWVIGRDGTGLRNVTDHPAGDSHPQWHPDGRHLVFTSNRGDGEHDDIYVMALDGSGLRRLTHGGPHHNTFPSYAPDGRRIAFRRLLISRGPEGTLTNSEVMVMQADGGGVLNISRHSGFDGWPSWSPDGEWIAFSSNRFDTFQIYMIRPDGTGLTRITNAVATDARPQWLPDSRGVVFNRDHDNRIEMLRVAVP